MLFQDTWPHFKGPAKDGVLLLVNALKYGKNEYRMGKTKIFIRYPKTLFATEDAFQEKKNYLASKIQAEWKSRQQRKKYLKLREDVVQMQKYIRRHLAIQRVQKRREAVEKIRAFIQGFITRNDPPNRYNQPFIAHAKRAWLIKLSQHLPDNLLETSWPAYPAHCAEASHQLRRYCKFKFL